MANKNYNLNCTDAYGINDEATAIFNDRLVPRLKCLNLTEEEIDNIYEIVKDIVFEAYCTGGDRARFDMEEGSTI